MNPNAGHSYRLIKTPAELKTFADRISKENVIAVDLEADSMFHYREKICLIQMGAGKDHVVIDPLDIDDLSPLGPIFKDKQICKVFHGADYDVRSLYRDFSIKIDNLFDTQLASMFLGQRETSLGAVVQTRFGIKMDKRFQKKDWSQRPLPDEMIAYAASDVYHLIPLARQIMEELGNKGRLNWVEEECSLLAGVRPVENDGKPLFLKFRGAGRLPRRNLAALEGLLQYRRRVANKKDRPLFKVFSNTSLLKIASKMAQSPQAMEQAHCLSPKQIRIYGKQLGAIVKKANQLAPADLPVYPRKRRPPISAKVPERIDAIKAWRDAVAERLQLDPALLFNKALMTAIAVNKPADIQGLRSIEGVRNWQAASFGQDLLTVLAKTP